MIACLSLSYFDLSVSVFDRLATPVSSAPPTWPPQTPGSWTSRGAARTPSCRPWQRLDQSASPWTPVTCPSRSVAYCGLWHGGGGREGGGGFEQTTERQRQRQRQRDRDRDRDRERLLSRLVIAQEQKLLCIYLLLVGTDFTRPATSPPPPKKKKKRKKKKQNKKKKLCLFRVNLPKLKINRACNIRYPINVSLRHTHTKLY